MLKKYYLILFFVLFAGCNNNNDDNCPEPGFELFTPALISGTVEDTILCPFWYWNRNRGYTTIDIKSLDSSLVLLSDSFICYFTDPHTIPPVGTDTIYDTLIIYPLSEGNFGIEMNLIICNDCSRNDCGGGVGPAIITFEIGGER
ncbi:hypothetical protein DRQ33_03945 [bacterium]|nr:MAG: hypothetical protein DRQ33_03945 [bacterium]